MAQSSIEWTDAVWNPVTGCSKVSPGCKHCYAERMAKRLAGRDGYPADEPFRVTLHPEKLDLPLRWRKPRRIFVNSMSDLFHPDVPDEFIERVFAVMALCPQHTFQVLTKRPERMQAYLSDPARAGRIARAVDGLRVRLGADDGEEVLPIRGYPGYYVSSLGYVYSEKRGGVRIKMRPDAGQQGHLRVQLHGPNGGKRGGRLLVHRLVLEAFVGPAPTEDSQACHLDGNPRNNAVANLRWGSQHDNWEDRKRHGTFRSYHKLTEEQVQTVKGRAASGETFAAIARDMGISETQVSNIAHGRQWATRPGVPWPLPNCWIGVSVENQKAADERIPLLLKTPAAVRFLSCEPLLGSVNLSPWLNQDFIPSWPMLDWLIVGGESGPGARPMHPDWARSLRDQCKAAGVPFLFKQWGQFCYPSQMPDDTWQRLDANINLGSYPDEPIGVGKKDAGRLLDGVLHDEYPEVHHVH